ncbi:MAG: DUF481 domain-containing protein [Melioribacteraceae bacterium]|nr:DUF481 domain-containing protein [Melioribacteraceae bacterium]
MIVKILFLIFISSTIFYAQVNTEKHRTSDDQEGLGGYMGISGNIKTGNTDKIQGNLEGRADYKTSNTTTFFVFETEHEWINDNILSGNGLLHVRNVISVGEKVKSELFGQINYDKSILLKNRELLGGGIRYLLFNSGKSDVALGTAYMFEHERYDLKSNAVHPNNISVSRWSNYLSYYIEFTKTIIMSGVVYYQPEFTDFADWRILAETNFELPITKVLSINMKFKMRHDSKPPDGRKKNDTNSNFGIAVRF